MITAPFALTGQDWRLIGAAVVGIGLSIWLIVKLGLHPFLGLICGTYVLGSLAGLAPLDTTNAIQAGFADVLGGAGIVIALGLILGALLQHSGAATALADAALRFVGERNAPWGSLLAAMLIGLPLFFETGVVLLLPIVAAAAMRIQTTHANRARGIEIMLPALAGLSVLHALLPPHPGPLLAVHELGASVSRTMLYGAIVAIPTAVLAGPAFARYIARHVSADRPIFPLDSNVTPPSLTAALIVVMLPVILISIYATLGALPMSALGHFGWLYQLGHPVVALLIAIGVALASLFPSRARTAQIRTRIWREAMVPAGTILLSIGAGGALKQVLVLAGLSKVLARFASTGLVSPMIMAWTIAALIRLGTGSATVATITAAGIMPEIVSNTGASRDWIVICIGAGSVFLSHVSDPGFWLVKAYLGTSTTDTFKTWSLLETLISVLGLILALTVSRLI